MLTANADQIRRALLSLTPDQIKADPKAMGWALISVLRKEGKCRNLLKVLENAIDWEATFIVQRYAEIARDLRASKKRVADHVVFDSRGIDEERTAAGKPVKS